MHSFIHLQLRRDREMERQKKEVKEARENLIKKGMSSKSALKKIKKVFMDAIKQK